ncbi:MAG: hypothetical protein M1818_001300 [Claussenomyces sp. TS43310]|nr:MAG: hypothetical protein M1818_001300 [Claussenomyces sp. TS43310]
MPRGTRKIPSSEWDAQRARIESLRLRPDLTLQDIIKSMEELHGFQASKAQYIRKLNQWGLSKNSTSEAWQFISHQVRKRELEGKESETFINGKMILNKKVKREISRYAVPAYQDWQTSAPSPEAPHGVCISTPAGEESVFIEYSHIPWFEFQTLIEQQFQLDGTFGISFAATSMPSYVSYDLSNNLSPELTVWSDMATIQPGTILIDPETETQGTSASWWSSQTNNLIGDEHDPSSPTADEANREARSILARSLGVCKDPDSRECISDVCERLEDVMIQMQDGELVKNVKKLYGRDVVDANIQFIGYFVFLSSNNQLADFQADNFLVWINKTKKFAFIERLIRTKTLTAEVLCSELLLSAVRIEDIRVVRTLLTLGADPNTRGNNYTRTTAIEQAIRCGNVEIVRLLLSAGANPNASNPYDKHGMAPLQIAVSRSHSLGLVQILLEAGAKVNVLPTTWFSHTLLEFAAFQGDLELAQCLLRAGATIDLMTDQSITALQAAAMIGSIDSVEMLLIHGADVNVPAGKVHKRAFQAVEMKAISHSFPHCTAPIQFAAERGNTELVQILLEAGADVNGYTTTDEDEELIMGFVFDPDCLDSDDEDEFSIPRTPLQAAVEHGNTLLVRQLLLAGANVSLRGLDSTVLQLASARGDIKLVQLLLKHFADINAPPRKIFKGMTAIQAAAATGKIELAKILINAGADINAAAACNYGRTALQAAVERGHFEMTQMLLSVGADIKDGASPHSGRTCLQAAAVNGDDRMIELLLQAGAEVNAPAAEVFGLTALQAAVERGHITSVHILLSAGADTNAPACMKHGVTALDAAIEEHWPELIKILLEKRANPNGNTSGTPPLIRAVSNGQAQIVQWLIEAGADVNALSSGDLPCSALQEAAADKGDVQIALILLEAQADIDVAAGGMTALDLALLGGDTKYDVARLLLARGADVNPAAGIDIPKSTCIGHLISGCHDPITIPSVLRELISAGADVNRVSINAGFPLERAARIGDVEIVRMLLDAGAQVNGSAKDQHTALQGAVATKNAKLVQVLLDAGADVNAPAGPELGSTALQAAVSTGNVRLVQLLLQHGADVNGPAGRSNGATALQRAAIGGHLKIALLLLQAGAVINAAPSRVNGRMALDAAAEHGRLDVVCLLLKNDREVEGLQMRCNRAAKLATSNGHPVIARLLREHTIS